VGQRSELLKEVDQLKEKIRTSKQKVPE